MSGQGGTISETPNETLGLKYRTDDHCPIIAQVFGKYPEAANLVPWKDVMEGRRKLRGRVSQKSRGKTSEVA